MRKFQSCTCEVQSSCDGSPNEPSSARSSFARVRGLARTRRSGYNPPIWPAKMLIWPTKSSPFTRRNDATTPTQIGMTPTEKRRKTSNIQDLVTIKDHENIWCCNSGLIQHRDLDANTGIEQDKHGSWKPTDPSTPSSCRDFGIMRPCCPKSKQGLHVGGNHPIPWTLDTSQKTNYSLICSTYILVLCYFHILVTKPNDSNILCMPEIVAKKHRNKYTYNMQRTKFP